jgi:hypothetical protein
LILFAFVAAAISGIAQEAREPVTSEEFERVINFDDSIETLAEQVRTQAYDQIDVERYFILDGSVASTQVFNPDPAAFQAVIELVSSEWIGLEEIRVHHVYVLVEDGAYASRLPERMPRDPGPGVIQTNQRLIVVGPFIGTAMLNPNLEVPVIRAVALR